MTFPRKMFSINNYDTVNNYNNTVTITASSFKSVVECSSFGVSCVLAVVVIVVVVVVAAAVAATAVPQWSVAEGVFADFQRVSFAAACSAGSS